MKGYLVVLSPDEAPPPGNLVYRGIDRLPPYPTSTPGEEGALEAYLVGGYKDAEGLLPTRESALELARRFDSSPRSFEVIYVRSIDEGRDSSDSARTFLGYDVAGDTPFWSIVGDWADPTLADLLRRRNASGLFNRWEDAKEYLKEYRSRYPDDAAVPLRILEIWLEGSA